jgi:Fe-S cluster assembly scaffold protein SufB
MEVHGAPLGRRLAFRCDTLIMDEESSSDMKSTMKIHEQRSTAECEASVSKIGE